MSKRVMSAASEFGERSPRMYLLLHDKMMALLKADDLTEAAALLNEAVAEIAPNLSTDVVIAQRQLSQLERDHRQGTITERQYNRGRNRITLTLINILYVL